MVDASADDRGAKRQARLLRDQAQDAFSTGDYRRVLALDRKVLQQGADAEAVAGAAAEVDRLAPDPWAIRVGALAVAVYAVAWALSLL